MEYKSIDILRDLSNAKGIPGFEDEVVETIAEYVSEHVETEESNIRNLYLDRVKNTREKPVVILDGHSDEVGFMVQSITDKGLLKFVNMGGWIVENVPAHKVKIKNAEGKYISGIFASKPPHFMSEAEKGARLTFDKLVIDVGATSREEVIEKFKIEVGAPVVPDVEFEYNEINDTVIGKAFDNRIGCALVVDVINELADDNLNIDLVGSISSQEEIGGNGAMVASNHFKPDVAIVFEGTPADDTFRNEFEAQSVLGKGPQIRHRDMSMVSNPRFTKFARDIAKELEIPFQDAVRIGGGTNGGVYYTAHEGVPTIVIGVPVRYAHTHYGISKFSDYELAKKWAVEIIKRLDYDTIKHF